MISFGTCEVWTETGPKYNYFAFITHIMYIMWFDALSIYASNYTCFFTFLKREYLPLKETCLAINVF